jgi:hypothetical protein
MHDLIVLLAFFGFVFAPAIVASNTIGEADGYRRDINPPDSAGATTKTGADTSGQ